MYWETFLSLTNNYKEALVDYGKALKQAKEEYKEMVGEGIDSWSDFLKQPEVGLTVREANSLIKLSDLIEALDVPIGQLNLSTVKFAANKGIVEPDLIEDMKVLTLQDFKEQHYDHSQQQEDAPRTYKYMLMKRCVETGNLSKVLGVEEDKILEKFSDEING